MFSFIPLIVQSAQQPYTEWKNFQSVTYQFVI